MEHRRSDTTDVTVQLERKIPLTWVIGGSLGVCVTLAVAFGTWAWNISLTLNNVSRDLAIATKTLDKLEAGQETTRASLNRGDNRDEQMAGRISDAERRLTSIETKIEARQAARQQSPP